MVDSGLRFGVMTYQFDHWPTLIDRWQWLEQLGFDSLWVGDHLWSKPGTTSVRPRMDTWAALASLAGATSTVRLGPLVVSTAYRNPAVIAKQTITLDHISNGRVDVGVGAGANPLDEASAGLGTLDIDKRKARFGESVSAIRGLLSTEPTTQLGSIFRFDRIASLPRPIQEPHPPLLVAAHADSSLRLAAEYGDGWCSFGGQVSPGRGGSTLSADEALQLTRSRSERLDLYAQAAGRPRGPVRRLLVTGFTDDRLWDSSQALIDFISKYKDIGINEFAFPFPTEEVDRTTLELMFADALSTLRKR